MHIEIFIHSYHPRGSVGTVKCWFVGPGGRLEHYTLLDNEELPGCTPESPAWDLLRGLYGALAAAGRRLYTE